MNLSIAIPVMNQLQDAKGPLGLLKYITSEDVEFIFIDNGSTDDYEDFLIRNLKPKKMQYIRNKHNLGVIPTMQQAYEACTSDVLALTHNDVLVYEQDWDKRILKYFEEMPDLGGVGFFGAQGCGPVGERIQDVPIAGIAAGFSNMLEAEKHGMRMSEDYREAAIFDGFMMIFRMEMLKKGNGFDMDYKYHHLYDRDASLESLRRGYRNIVVNVPSHHLSGLTANRTEYQEWINKKTGQEEGDKWIHDDNTRIFKEKYKDVLPLYVETDGSYRTGTQGQWEFKGGAIKQ